MKNTAAILGQFLLFALFLTIFFGGGLLALFHLDPFGAPHWFLSHPTPTSTRYFVPTGLLLMTVLFVIVIAIQAATKRLPAAGKWTTLVYLLAVVVGFLAKFGSVQHDLY